MASDAAPPHDLTGFQRDCLVAVDRLGATKGLAVGDLLSEHYGQVNHGRLYPNLDVLVEKGLLSKRELDGRTNEYSTTSRGERLIEDYAAWVGGDDA